jgi:hypothetical protein
VIIEIPSTGERVESQIVEDDPAAPPSRDVWPHRARMVQASADGGGWVACRRGVATRTPRAGGSRHHGSGAVAIGVTAGSVELRPANTRITEGAECLLVGTATADGS